MGIRVRNESDLGLLIRETRKERGWDQAELAARVGVSRKWVVEAEAGKPRAELALVLRALRVLDVRLTAESAPPGREPGDTPHGLGGLHALLRQERGDGGEDER